MTLSEALYIGTASIGRRDALLLLEKLTKTYNICFNLYQPFLYNNSNADDSSPPLSPEAVESFEDMLVRRFFGVPVQYILGEWEFMGLPFQVGPDVLIPRADTEILVETALSCMNKKPNGSWRILDLCTGSGCIAVALAHYHSGAMVTASDISPAALLTAQANARLNGVADKIRFTESDLFDTIDGEFDIITANPPYIPTDQMDSLPTGVLEYEPKIALDGGTHGMRFYRPIIDNAKKHLTPGGILLLEVGPCETVVEYLKGNGFLDIAVINDYAGFARVVKTHKSEVKHV